jgi:hypothetical protein
MSKADGQDTADRLSGIVANSWTLRRKRKIWRAKRIKAARSSTGLGCEKGLKTARLLALLQLHSKASRPREEECGSTGFEAFDKPYLRILPHFVC